MIALVSVHIRSTTSAKPQLDNLYKASYVISYGIIVLWFCAIHFLAARLLQSAVSQLVRTQGVWLGAELVPIIPT